MTTKEPLKKIQTRREVVIVLPPFKAPGWLQGFVNFVREQGVVGLAVGLVLGVAAKSVVDSLVQNIFNPVIGLLYGGGDLNSKYICLKTTENVCQNKLGYGSFANTLVSFLIVCATVYFVVKKLKLDKIDVKSTK